MTSVNTMPRSRREFSDDSSGIAHFDWPLLFVLVSIALLGVVMIFSASMPFAEKNYGDAFHFINRQLIFLSAGIGLGIFLFRFTVSDWEKYAPYLLGITLLMLLLVLVPGIGKSVNGSRRWIDLGVVSVQVSEAVKLAVIVYLASYLVRQGEKIQSQFGAFIRPLLVISFAGVLLLLEPDFGATVVIILTAMGMLFVGGAQFRQFVSLIVFFGIAAALAVWFSPYRMRRFTSFLNPWADPYNDGFQLSQSLIAIGSGSLNGVGLGSSVQKLFYLPESHTDFLFAVYAEETGLVGVVFLVALFSFVVWRCMMIASRAVNVGNRFAGFVALGIGIWIGLQAFINMGVNMGILPTKGITLPLMSYGGSSLVIMCLTISLLFRVDHETRVLETRNLTRRKKKTAAGERV